MIKIDAKLINMDFNEWCRLMDIKVDYDDAKKIEIFFKIKIEEAIRQHEYNKNRNQREGIAP